ncbi:MAG: Bifunctional protein: zinc-containing alcohol dehydrogenase [Myxococcales bacterium]|nr:Bifunctional protein: zinc-containing alcohol dehydrogenase [Myxococcales bacterium]
MAGRAKRKASPAPRAATARSKKRPPTRAPRMTVVPTTMKAAAIDRFGPPDVLTSRTVPTPRVGPGEVLIALHAAGVGFWDAKIRDGTWAEGDERFPLILGSDGAGTIAALGSRVRGFDLDQPVWAYAYENEKGGFYAEYVAVATENAAPCPARLDLLHAGAAAVTAMTAQQGIDDHLGVRRGETVLVFGGTGAVGTLAIQFARRKQARVVATASGRAAAELVRQLGSHGSFDARNPKELMQLPALAPNGIDAVLALAGGDALERCLDLMNPGGRVAYPNGVEPAPRARRGLKVRAYDATPGRRQWQRLDRAVSEARLTVPIAATYPLARAAQAHARVEKGHVVGRVALQIRRG